LIKFFLFNMWINQQRILEPSSTPQSSVRVDGMSTVSTFQQLSLSDHVNIGARYHAQQKKITQPKSITRNHVGFAGADPLLSCSSDQPTYRSGYQAFPIHFLSGSWVAPETIFLNKQPILSSGSVYKHYGIEEYIPIANFSTTSPCSVSSDGQFYWTSPVVVGRLNEDIVESQRHHAPRENHSLQNLGVYLQDRSGSKTPSFAPPSVVSSVEGIQLPAYTREAKSYLPPANNKQRQSICDVTPLATPIQSMSKLGLFPGRRKTSTEKTRKLKTPYFSILQDKSSLNLQRHSNLKKKDKVPVKVRKKLKVKGKNTLMNKEDKAASKVKGRPKAVGLVRYTIPTSAGKEKIFKIKVDWSKPSANMIEIEHGHPGDIFIGNLEGACSYELCKKNNIAVIMNLSTKAIKKHPKITYYAFPIGDLPCEDIFSLFNMSSDIIDSHLQAGQNVLVNCNMGVSRSTTIVLAYIIKKTEMELDAALALCRRFRACCNPNPGFIKQLKRYQHQQLTQEKKVRKVAPHKVHSSQTISAACQRFSSVFPSYDARANNEVARTSSKAVVPRQS